MLDNLESLWVVLEKTVCACSRLLAMVSLIVGLGLRLRCKWILQFVRFLEVLSGPEREANWLLIDADWVEMFRTVERVIMIIITGLIFFFLL